MSLGLDLPANEPLSRLGYSVRGLANWILDYADELKLTVSNMALNKLVYFAFEKMLLEKQAIITDAKIEAWEHGPVFREIYQSFKLFGDRPITNRAEFYSVETGLVESVHLDADVETEAYLKAVLLPLMTLSASKLREISHVPGGAWHRVWCYEGHANPGMEITPTEIIEAASERGSVNG